MLSLDKIKIKQPKKFRLRQCENTGYLINFNKLGGPGTVRMDFFGQIYIDIDNIKNRICIVLKNNNRQLITIY